MKKKIGSTIRFKLKQRNDYMRMRLYWTNYLKYRSFTLCKTV